MITGTMPCLETPEGTICESASIARFFASHDSEKHLGGKGQFEQAMVNQWIDFMGATVGP